MKNPIKTLNNYLTRQGYNSSERFRLYRHMVAGATIPLVISRYTCAQTITGDLDNEALSWAVAGVISIVPSAAGAVAGLLSGVTSVLISRISKRQKQSRLEDKAQEKEFKGFPLDEERYYDSMPKNPQGDSK